MSKQQAIEYLKTAQSPKELTHWTTESGVKSLFGNDIRKNNISNFEQFPQIKSDSLIAQLVPQLKSVGGLFTNADPILGNAYDDVSEVYVRKDRNTGSPPVLLIFTLISEPKVAKILTMDSGEVIRLGEPIESADLIHHLFMANGQLQLQEWVLLNPRSVEAITSGSMIIKAYLTGRASKLATVEPGSAKDMELWHSQLSLNRHLRILNKALADITQRSSELDSSLPEPLRNRSAVVEHSNFSAVSGPRCNAIFTAN